MAYNFNTQANQTIDRKLLILYLNTGSYSEPVWSPIGKRVEDSSAEYDWSKESKKDILGLTYTTLKTPVITQSFEPVSLDAGDEASKTLYQLAIVQQDAAALAAQDVLIVHFYMSDSTTATKFFAERYTASAFDVKSIGGEGGGTINMPFEVTMGGVRLTGFAAKTGNVVSFTADAA